MVLPASTLNLQHGITSPIRTSDCPSILYKGILNASNISYSHYRSTIKSQPYRIIVWSAFEADKLCLGDFASSSATRLSDCTLYFYYRSIIKVGLRKSWDLDWRVFVGVDHQLLKTAITPFLSIYSLMAPSTRTKAHRGATTTGTTGPTVSDSSVMRTRSGFAINPPTDQDKCKKIMSFEDYAQILARPRKPKVKPLVDPVISDIQLHSDCAPAASPTDDEDDGMGDADKDQADEGKNEEGENEYDEDEDNQDSGRAKTSKESDNNAKDTDEEPDNDENNEDRGRAKTSPVTYSTQSGDFGPESSYTSFHAKREHPARSDQVSAHESDADEDLNHDSPSSPPAKRRKTSSAVNITSVNTTRSTTIRNKHVHASISRSADDHTPSGIVFGPTPDNEPTENEEELPGNLKRGRLCQEGIDEAQELGCKTAEEAQVIGVKYGKSARAILIEAGLSIKHSRSESDWNAHQCWFMDNNPCKDKESIVDWKERQCTHYHAMGKDNKQWDTIRNYSITGGNIDQSRAKTILSMREDIARKLSAYSRLEGVEAVGCIFDTTQDEAARQASGFIAGSDLIVKLINEHQLDAHAILDWVVTATKVKGYNISIPQFMGGVGAYEILLSKPNEAPRDCYRRIWPIMVLKKTSKFGYRPKAVQWRKLLDYAFQYKFMIKNWPDDVTPIGPEFNPHNLSSQHLKLLVVPFIKRKAHSYYEAELRTEAENLFEIEKKKSKGKRRGQERTVEDVMSELDVDASEIEFAAWPDERLKQLSDEVPEMFDIPLVTSTLDVVLRKLVDSAKFKASIPEDILAVHQAHSQGPISSTAEMLPGGHESSSPTSSSPALPSNQHHTTMATPVHHREGSHPTRLPDLLDRESHLVRPTRRGELAGGGP
ncbi:uncharacterized protein F5147DRAFT_659235 [Suillus discolor]|uniref:Uncharacterized protein n=1 Tax=Suillus discolor TaxID=1912936 RepID=A0A9P7JLI0_9AGAM|nr:uncharacterized protein F5147DRAFT_659235 [Suillus discolor]KAG2086314.1 hypothetical protein F5147DRAFT_659235 [Suillus discolor]